MKKTILEIYALAVCFASVVCATIALGFALWGALEIANPAFTMRNYIYEQYQDNESYRTSMPRSCDEYDSTAAADIAAAAAAAAAAGEATARNRRECVRYSEAQITAKREAGWARELRKERRDGLQTLIQCLLVLLVDLIAFVPHWILAKRARATTAA